MIKSSNSQGRDFAPNKNGFALLVTLVLMAMLVLLVVSLATFVRVETSVATNHQQINTARQNALLALNVALGKLQEVAGPDQRATATADLFTGSASGAPVNGTRYWTGVWGNANPSSHTKSSPRLLNWLVSGNELVSNEFSDTDSTTFGQVTSAAASPPRKPSDPVLNIPNYSASNPTQAALATTITVGGQEARVLAGPSSTGTGSTAGYVVAPVQTLVGEVPGIGTKPIGRYAWWVGDEGVKARINLLDQRITATSSETSLQQETRERSRYQLAQRSATELVTGLASFAPSPTSGLDRVLNRQQLPYLQTTSTPIATTVPADRFHDITTYSVGVLSDTLRGGLKRDLTAGFATGTTSASPPLGRIWDIRSFPDVQLAANVSLVNDANLQNGYDGLGPNWQLLRSYAQIADTITGSGSTATVNPQAHENGDTRHGFTPVVAAYRLYFEARLVNAGGANGYRLELRHVPSVVLWNPYNVRLADSPYRITYDFNSGTAIVYARVVQAPANATSCGGLAAYTDSTTAAHVSSPYFYSLSGYHPGSSTNVTQRSLQLQLQSGVMEPGQAYIYTLSSDQVFNPVNNWAPMLTREWRAGAATGAGILIQSGVFQLPPVPPGQAYRGLLWASGSNGAPSTPPDLINVNRMPVATNASININNLAASDRVFVAIPGNDRLVLRLGGGPNDPIAQSVGQNNPFLRWDTVQSTLDRVITPPSTSLPIGWAGLGFRMKITNPYSLGYSSTSSLNMNVPWLSMYNPRAAESARSAYEAQMPTLGNGYYSQNPSYIRLDEGANGTANGRFGSNALANSSTYPLDIQNPSQGIVSFGRDYATSVPVAPFNIPTPVSPLVSLGQLQHVNAYRASAKSRFVLAHNYYPAYPIGNSLINPRIPDDAVVGSMSGGSQGNSIANPAVFFDHSYLLNRAIFDSYFFSTVPPTGDLLFPLTNGRLSRYKDASDSALRSYTQSAASLLMNGGFNINSSSTEAWRSVLAATRNVPVGATTRSSESPMPRTPWPVDDAAVMTASSSATLDTNASAGYRFLTDAQITSLANSIVTTVRRRGPVVSLADFVNRSLSSANLSDRRRGTLDRSITDTATATHPNRAFLTGSNEVMTLPPLNNAYTPYPSLGTDVTDIPIATGLPGWLTQGDVLQVLAPILTPRSDTFVIRVYGETVNPALTSSDPNYIQGRAWAEAVVQRLPDYTDTNQTADLQPVTGNVVNLNTTNSRFGRRFVIVSLRWLSPSDI